MEVDQPPLSLSLVIPLTTVHPALFGLTHGTQAITILSPPFFVGSFGKVVLPRRTPVLHIHKLEASGGDPPNLGSHISPHKTTTRH